MTIIRACALALGLMAAFGASLAAQANVDSTSRALVASERAIAGRASGLRTIAVLPFAVTSPDSTLAELGYGLAEFLSDDLAHSHRLVLVERARIADIQREQNLTLTGNIDPETSALVGRLVAAQHLIFGSIDATDADAVTIEEHSVEVATGAIEMHHSVSTPIDAIFRAERDLVMQTFSTFDITLTADEKRALYERVPPAFRSFLAFSRGVRAEQQGHDALAAASFQAAAALDRNFTLATTKLAATRVRMSTRAASPITATPRAPKQPTPAPRAQPKLPHRH